jgi:hypothetical protein
MSSERCAVPNCNNPATTGIPFPKQSEIQEKWLISLEIKDFVPTSTSFVCLDHFGDGDVLDRVTGKKDQICNLVISFFTFRYSS